MWRTTRLVATIAGIGILVSFVPGVAGAQERVDTVTVEARKRIDVEPDLAILSVGVTARGRTAEAALDRLSGRTGRVLRAFRRAGYDNDELSTFGVSLQRTCLRNCGRKARRAGREPVFGYRGSAGIRLETSRVDSLGRAIDVAVSAGARKIRGVSFDVEDKTAAVNEALSQAMDIAIEKAEVLAEKAGRELGPAIVIEEGNTQAPETFNVPAADLEAVGAASAAGRGSGGSGPFPIDPPTLTASARVEVTFELQ